MKTTAEIADEYERNLVLLRQRRAELKAQAQAEPSAKLRHALTERIVLINEIIASTTAALDLMLRYGK